MIVTLTIVLLPLCFAVLLFYWARGRVRGVTSVADVASLTVPVDVKAMMNLLDPAQQMFLAARLSEKDFRTLQVERTKVLLEYVHRIAHNSAVLISLGHTVMTNVTEPQLAAQGQELVTLALRTRLLALAAMVMLYTSAHTPWVSTCLEMSVGRYQSAKARMDVLGGLLAASHEPSAG